MNVNDSDPSDESLIRDILAGNKEAFVQLVSRYKRKVFGMASRFARDADDLEDICQDVFIKVYENLGSFRAEAPFEHWLSRICIRVCYDALRSRKKEKGNVPLERVHNFLADQSAGSDRAAEARSILEWGLARLKPDEQLVITLLEIEEKSIREIADMTGWSEANVKVRAFRAREKLKQLLEKQYEKES
jgi:RNA polymerase sigma-70 factor (ECF subfamily)